MRILFLNATGALGGAERLLLDVFASIRQAEPAADLHLMLADVGPLADEARKLGVAVHLLPLPESLLQLGETGARGPLGLAAALIRRGHSAWTYASQLRRFIDARAPDVVHSISLKLLLLSSLAHVRSPLLVWHLHDFISGRAMTRRGLRWAAKRAGGAIAISRAVAEDARAQLPGSPHRVRSECHRHQPICPWPGQRRVFGPTRGAQCGAGGNDSRRPGGYIRDVEGPGRIPRSRGHSRTTRRCQSASMSLVGRSTRRTARNGLTMNSGCERTKCRAETP